MVYDNQSKYEMLLRQTRVDLGQSMGNAISNAVSWVKDNKIYKDLGEEALLNKIYEIAEQFSHFSQITIDKKFSQWLELNDEDLRIKYGLQEKVVDIEQNDVSGKLEL